MHVLEYFYLQYCSAVFIVIVVKLQKFSDQWRINVYLSIRNYIFYDQENAKNLLPRKYVIGQADHYGGTSN